MSIFSIAGSIWGLADPSRKDDFSGSFSVTIGSCVSGLYGSTQSNFFGNRIIHVCGGEAFGLKGLLGKFFMELIEGPLALLGLAGNTTWIYGPNTTAVYGGPVTQIRRGSELKMVSDAPLEFSGLPAFGQGQVFFLGRDPTDAAGLDMKAAQATISKAVGVLSVLLNLSNAILDLAIRFGYPDFEKKGKPDNAPTGAKVLKLADSLVPGILMGIMYELEYIGVYGIKTDSYLARIVHGQELLPAIADRAALLGSAAWEWISLRVLLIGYWISDNIELIAAGLLILSTLAVAIAVTVEMVKDFA